jgi:hypothetical protein
VITSPVSMEIIVVLIFSVVIGGSEFYLGIRKFFDFCKHSFEMRAPVVGNAFTYYKDLGTSIHNKAKTMNLAVSYHYSYMYIVFDSGSC